MPSYDDIPAGFCLWVGAAIAPIHSFILVYCSIGFIVGDYEYVTNCITFNLVIDKHMRYHYKNIEQTHGYTSAQYFALLFF